MTLSIGIEGPVLAGKSTLAADLALRLQRYGTSCAVVQCFVDAARQRHLALPDPAAPAADMRLSAVLFYAEIDQLRRTYGDVDIVLLDRTCWTLLAHTAAINRRVPVLRNARRAVDWRTLTPDYVVYLDIPLDVQLARAQSRPPLAHPFLDARFNARFRSYFRRTQHVHKAVWIDATQSMVQVVDAALMYVEDVMARRSTP
jgi:thymidylate kinase